VFRNLLIADFVFDIGTFKQSVGAAWLMVSLCCRYRKDQTKSPNEYRERLELGPL
jgi:hypothetical protein